MKTIHRLKTHNALAAVVLAVLAAELIAWQVTKALDLRFDGVAIGAVAAGAVLAFFAWRYDGDGYE
ncbi:MAG TPA: hypothetical protein VHD62_03175 [Opitutaceae bacterium]|nr:hypothetical protein [Opitutaceae bacterium]